MATTAQVQALLGVPCPHCRAARGEACGVAAGPRPRDAEGGIRRQARLPITTLDGGSHDARWVAALGTSAPVVPEALEERQQRPVGVAEPVMAGDPVRVGVLIPDSARPW